MFAIDRSILRGMLWAGCAALPLGCQPAQSTQVSPPPMTVTVRGQSNGSGPDSAARPEQIENAIHSDPCAQRLQEISGALLEYYALHNRLPAALTELNALPDLDQPLTFTCPASNKPFVYVPAGLTSPTDPQRIVLYDPAVDRAGLRWVIRLRRPRGHDAAATFVEHMPESVFRTFAQAAQ